MATMTFIDNAILLAKTRGLSQKELARLSNIAPTRLSEWKNNIGSPSLVQAIRIAKALGVGVDRLLLEDRRKVLATGTSSSFEAVTEDERSILDLYRALGLSKPAAMRALAQGERESVPPTVERERRVEPRDTVQEARLEFLPPEQAKLIELAPSAAEASGSIMLLEIETGDVIRHGLVFFVAVDTFEPLRPEQIQDSFSNHWPADVFGFRIDGDFEWAIVGGAEAQNVIARLGLSKKRFRQDHSALLMIKNECMILEPGCADLYLPGPAVYLCLTRTLEALAPGGSHDPELPQARGLIVTGDVPGAEAKSRRKKSG